MLNEESLREAGIEHYSRGAKQEQDPGVELERSLPPLEIVFKDVETSVPVTTNGEPIFQYF